LKVFNHILIPPIGIILNIIGHGKCYAELHLTIRQKLLVLAVLLLLPNTRLNGVYKTIHVESGAGKSSSERNTYRYRPSIQMLGTLKKATRKLRLWYKGLRRQIRTITDQSKMLQGVKSALYFFRRFRRSLFDCFVGSFLSLFGFF
jgi:hypothetical protein